MLKRLAAMAAAGGLVVLVVGMLAAAGASLNLALSRYPGAAATSDDVYDLALVRRGWISRQARYETADDLEIVTRWYAALLQMPPDGDVHAAANCLSMRSERLNGRLVRSRSVRLCSTQHGTQIVVHENWFYSPPGL